MKTVQAGTGNITLFKSDNTQVEVFDVTTDVTVSGATVTLDPAAPLDSLQGYYVQVASTAVEDTSNNAYAGIGDTTTLSFTTADSEVPTVIVSGPSVAVSGSFDAIATFSESVTGLLEEEITVANGTITNLVSSDSGSVYTITIDPTVENIVSILIGAGVAQDVAGNLNAISNTFTIQAGSPASAFEAKKVEVEKIITDEVMRTLSAGLATNSKFLGAAKGRFVKNNTEVKKDSDLAMIGGRWKPFEHNYSFSANDEQANLSGDFVKQFGEKDDNRERVVSGDYEILRDDNGSITSQVNTRVAWEKQLNEETMLASFLGINFGRSNFSGSFDGSQDSYGGSIGGYVVTKLKEDLIFDGFASFSQNFNTLSLADSILDIKSDYQTQTKSFGGSLTGIIYVNKFANGASYSGSGIPYFEIWPEVQLSYSKTNIGKMDFTGKAYGLVDNSLSIDKTSVSSTSTSLTAHFKVPLDDNSVSDSYSTISISPRIKYEQTRAVKNSTDIGGGVMVDLMDKNQDKTAQVNVKITLDRIGSTTSASGQIKYEKRF